MDQKQNSLPEGPRYPCQKWAKTSPNGYFNYLRHFKRVNCGKFSPQGMFKYGAGEWRSLPQEQKEHFNNMLAEERKEKARKQRLYRERRAQRAKEMAQRDKDGDDESE